MDLPTLDLIGKSKRGDSKAFSRLIQVYENKIFDLALKIFAHDPSIAHLIYRDTFLTAFRDIKKLKETTDLKVWFYQIASQQCLLRFQKKRGDPPVSILDTSHQGNHDRFFGISIALLRQWKLEVQSPGRRNGIREAIRQALGDLPIDYRLIVVMRDVHGLSSENIAKILRSRIASVQSRLHRGRLFLRERLEILSQAA